MGTNRKVKFRPNPSMLHCQKSTTLFKYIQELSTVLSWKARNNYPRPDELLIKRSELITRCRHAKKFLLCSYR